MFSSGGQHPLHRRPVQVQPVAGHVQAHAELEEQGGARVQQSQVDQETHGGTAVRQHVQHGPKPGPWKMGDVSWERALTRQWIYDRDRSSCITLLQSLKGDGKCPPSTACGGNQAALHGV